MPANHIAQYPQLQEVLESNEKLVYLCGAGASMALGGHRNSWERWLLEGRPYLSPTEQAAFDRTMGSRSADELVQAASYLLDTLKANQSYRVFMDETIGALRPTQQTLSAALRKIRRAGDLLTTTNYDQLIEQAVGTRSVAYDTPGEILAIIKGTAENRVIHLHGVYDGETETDNVIADGNQYREILENEGAQFIQNLLGTHPLLIVGCGGTVSDPNLSGFLKFVLHKLGLNVPYFYVTREGDTIPELPANVIPVYYGSEYADLPVFMDELSSYRLRSRESTRALVELDPYVEIKQIASGLGRMHFSNRFSPFVGRQDELAYLDTFLGDDEVDSPKFQWWIVLGEGGAGKSRLILEWLRALPSNWYGFFARKNPAICAGFEPFTDTVVAFDYILGEEERCAQSILALAERFGNSPYRLRLLLIERRQNEENEDWLARLYQGICSEERLLLERAKFLGGAAREEDAAALTVGPLREEEELRYISNYLSAYTAAFPDSSVAQWPSERRNTTSQKIFESYRASLDAADRRPLYLSIFTEVWVDRSGAVDLRGAKRLLKAYLEKEIGRWRTSFQGNVQLLNAYLRLLAMACAAGQFNLADVSGDNYLRDDCTQMTSFLDEQDKLLGSQGLFDDLFVWMDILEPVAPDDPENGAVFLHAMKNESIPTDEKFLYAAPYVKLSADPEIFYLTLLKGVGALSEEEEARLDRLRQEQTLAAAALPDHGWIIEPALPDIIKSFLVLYVVRDRDLERFTKLARSNSVYGISQFLSRAIVDWPGETAFQAMLLTPPNEVIEYFEFYLPLLTETTSVADFRPVEKILIETEATLLFAKCEMKLWSQIAVVLTGRGNWDRLLDSGRQFIKYVEEDPSHPKIQEALTDVMSAYCVGLHNAEEVEKYATFLSLCDGVAELYDDEPAVARFCCKQRGLLIHLKRYLEQSEQLDPDWDVIAKYLVRHPDDRELCLDAMEAADEYLFCCRQANKLERVKDLTALLEQVFQHHHVVEVAELLAISTANQYTMQYTRKMDATSVLFEKVREYWRDFPKCQRVQSAYASLCGYEYHTESIRTSDVPHRLLERLRKWSEQYPDEIEFQEAYFYLLHEHLKYTQLCGMHKEEIRTFREMEAIAQRANYDIYQEANKLLLVIERLKEQYNY
jgi:hypothetical protein